MQKAARDAVERGLQELDAREGYTSGRVQGALLCMEAKTGAIRAMVGAAISAKANSTGPPSPSANPVLPLNLLFIPQLSTRE